MAGFIFDPVFSATRARPLPSVLVNYPPALRWDRHFLGDRWGGKPTVVYAPVLGEEDVVEVTHGGRHVARAARWLGGKIVGGTKWALRTIWRAASALGRAGWAVIRAIATAMWNVVVWAWYFAQIGLAFWDFLTASVAAIAFAALGQWGFAAAAAAVAIAVYYVAYLPAVENYCQRYC